MDALGVKGEGGGEGGGEDSFTLTSRPQGSLTEAEPNFKTTPSSSRHLGQEEMISETDSRKTSWLLM